MHKYSSDPTSHQGTPKNSLWLKWAAPGALIAFVGACSAGQPSVDDGVGSGSSSGNPVGGTFTGSGGGGAHVGGGFAAGGGGVVGTGGVGTVEVGGIEIKGNPRYYRVVRITHSQWEKSVRDLLQLPEQTGLSSAFFPDPKEGAVFSNNEESLFVTDTLATDYERAAQTVAEDVTSDATALGRLGNANNPQGFIAEIGSKAHKRPLTTEESAEYLELWNLAPTVLPEMSAFAGGARIFLEALLQSTHFVHRLELSETASRLSGEELATKISYLFFDTLPSDELMQAAESGALNTNAGLVTEVTKILDDPAAMENVRRFFNEYYSLDREADVVKDEQAFPSFTQATATALRDADVLFFDHIFTSDQGVSDIFLSTTAFANRDLASIYGATVNGTQLQQIDVPDRPGFLTRAGFLAVNGTLKLPDPIHRGVDINRRMLCADLNPPAGEIPPLPTPKSGQTNREAVAELTGVGICAECHESIINPPGFALEGFDAIGKARTIDNGKPIDTSGTFGKIPGNPAFTGASDMAEILASSETAHACFSARLAEFTLSRDLSTADTSLITALAEQSHGTNKSIKSLILALVQSPAFTDAETGAQ